MSTATLSPRTWATVQGLFAQRYQHAVAKVAQLVRTNRLPLNHALTMAHLFGEALAEHGEKLIPDELEHLAAQVTAARQREDSSEMALAAQAGGEPRLASSLPRQKFQGKPKLAQEGAVSRFPALARDYHAHLDRCPQCRDHPFQLCATGAAILLGKGAVPA